MVRQRDLVCVPLHGTGRLDVIGKVRAINGALALALLVFFLGHAASGTFDGDGVPDFAMVALWTAVVVAACHVVLSIVTSRNMLTDDERPPSSKKKAHLVLKWASGIVLLLVAAIHCQLFNGENILCAALLLVALAWHGWVGIKSLVRDIFIPKTMVFPLRCGLCAIVAIEIFSMWIIRCF